MSTSAPVRKVHSIPIIEPYRPLRQLPQAPVPAEPIRIPIYVPELVPVRVVRYAENE